ncbi:metal-sensing transcriptional repressor [Undibacterium luofuense]|uniref:Metal-sensing transcriptional repressor n=1 Tax=Undibacterium luofuense TaxID=2828733 RepID=A0A941DLU4_9BURK|nr:metal-sensing transcriptional repressor [Undibacterium luofuense]MBR7783497.1 metal-sensing transcriptional repressor [Undibacterium luofuense]
MTTEHTPSPVSEVSGALQTTQRKDLLHRLARVEGQIRGIQKLIAQEQPADQELVAQQMLAARKALDKSYALLLSYAVQNASADDAEGWQQQQQRIARLLEKFA